MRFRAWRGLKPLGPNRIRRQGYCRACCRWDQVSFSREERRTTHSALTHSLHFKLTHGGKSPLSNLRLILAAVGSLVRSAVAAALAGNQTLKFISMHLEAQGVEAFTGLSCRCALGMDLETLSNHYVTVVCTCCIKSNLTLSQ